MRGTALHGWRSSCSGCSVVAVLVARGSCSLGSPGPLRRRAVGPAERQPTATGRTAGPTRVELEREGRASWPGCATTSSGASCGWPSARRASTPRPASSTSGRPSSPSTTRSSTAGAPSWPTSTHERRAALARGRRAVGRRGPGRAGRTGSSTRPSWRPRTPCARSSGPPSDDGEAQARRILTTAIQRLAAQQTAESVVSASRCRATT